MMQSGEKIALVTLERQFARDAFWPSDKSQPVIAGTGRALKQLQEDGFDAINPYEAMSSKDRTEIAGKLAHVAIKLPEIYRQAGFGTAESDLLAGKAMRELNAHLAMEKVLEACNLDPRRVIDEAVYRPLKKPLMPSHDKWASYSGKPDFLDRALLFNDPYILQFSTVSGQMKDNVGDTSVFSFEMGKRGKSPSYFSRRNKRLIYKKFKNRSNLRYALFVAAGIDRKPAGAVDISALLDEIGCKAASAKISRLVDEFHIEYETCRITLTRWLAGQKNLPDAGLFNLFEKSSVSGFAAALMEHNVPVRFRTHGGLVVHGSKERQAITGLLARTIYNEPENTTVLLPRSPLQIHFPQSQSKIESKINPVLLNPVKPEDDADQRPFFILMAPNHNPWYWNFHGVTICDFESAHTIRWFAKLFSAKGAGKNGMRLNIRIKTTVDDKGRSEIVKHRQGMAPEDFNDLYDPAMGIYDVSLDSYQARLKEADLIVSEGVTAVFFEALENRKPLLLLNRGSERAASLPGFDLSQGKLPDQRHAIYCATCEQDLMPALERIEQLHKGKPLENHELEGLVWI